MTTLEITISLASTWPTTEELAARYAIEDVINERNIGIFEGAGGGRGTMDVAYRVEDNSLSEARETIKEVLAKLLPNSQYNAQEIKQS